MTGFSDISSLHSKISISILIQSGNTDVVVIKGAPDLLINKMRYMTERNGVVREIGADDLNRIVEMQNEWCVLGERVLLVAYKMCNYARVAVDYRNKDELAQYVLDSEDFCFAGLVGIVDKPRDGLNGVIAKIKAAGIHVFMMTGDHALTATSLALQCGLLSTANFHTLETMQMNEESESGTRKAAAAAAKAKANKKDIKNDKKSLLLTGTDLVEFEPDDWRVVASYEEIVFARVTPEQKVRVAQNTINPKSCLQFAIIAICFSLCHFF